MRERERESLERGREGGREGEGLLGEEVQDRVVWRRLVRHITAHKSRKSGR